MLSAQATYVKCPTTPKLEVEENGEIKLGVKAVISLYQLFTGPVGQATVAVALDDLLKYIFSPT